MREDQSNIIFNCNCMIRKDKIIRKFRLRQKTESHGSKKNIRKKKKSLQKVTFTIS